jgi:hypothetical protein
VGDGGGGGGEGEGRGDGGVTCVKKIAKTPHKNGRTKQHPAIHTRRLIFTHTHTYK